MLTDNSSWYVFIIIISVNTIIVYRSYIVYYCETERQRLHFLESEAIQANIYNFI